MKKLPIILVVLAAIALLFYAGNVASRNPVAPNENEAAAVGALTASESLFDFATISMKEGTVSRLFAVKNGSEKSVTVKKVTTSCMCTEAFVVNGERRRGPFSMPGHGFVPPVNEIVPAGGAIEIDVVFDPAAHGPAGVGRIERAVFIEDESGNIQTITIRALVTP